jgi:hypothetical protein
MKKHINLVAVILFVIALASFIAAAKYGVKGGFSNGG